MLGDRQPRQLEAARTTRGAQVDRSQRDGAARATAAAVEGDGDLLNAVDGLPPLRLVRRQRARGAAAAVGAAQLGLVLVRVDPGLAHGGGVVLVMIR